VVVGFFRERSVDHGRYPVSVGRSAGDEAVDERGRFLVVGFQVQTRF